MFDETRSTLSSHSQTTVRGPVESPGTDGFAIASLLCGLPGLVPLSALFGILALVRISRSKESGRGLAIAGLVLSVVWLGVGLTTVVPKLLTHAASGPDYIHTMAAGDCLNSGADGEYVTRVSCDQPHDEQVVKRVDVSSGYETYPGVAALRDPALLACEAAAVAYFTEGTPPPSLKFMAHLPTEDSWADGVREATCTFRQVSGQLTAFVRP
ncbi:DUF4190 domain-containing protein [Amycolatopsis mongoliensis]|uniref:DUF4190 domain-containing protein n=1 Tax=Amycolatopsis mongoliensis TaxID=715475 RepID=A0A9Y2JXW6_9PSEU|nr:DUF4190 domain-containing protein [Amycolatopsis sp. 4-36]WIY06718.1 DUF4190 domain-containing protein [Amycolatopsis sp. 4-36]